MSSARGRANHQLYLARIVLASWREALARQDIPANILAQAFLGGARDHLLAAYGWFLLEVSRAESLPGSPPRCCAELPAQPEGTVFPAEIREFQQLEDKGWLSELLLERDPIPIPVHNPNNLAIAAADQAGPDQVERWLEQLAAAFDRMSASLDEY